MIPWTPSQPHPVKKVIIIQISWECHKSEPATPNIPITVLQMLMDGQQAVWKYWELQIVICKYWEVEGGGEGGGAGWVPPSPTPLKLSSLILSPTILALGPPPTHTVCMYGLSPTFSHNYCSSRDSIKRMEAGQWNFVQVLFLPWFEVTFYRITVISRRLLNY